MGRKDGNRTATAKTTTGVEGWLLRKWGKTRVTSSPTVMMMLQLVLMISTLNLSSCAGREYRSGGTPRTGLVSLSQTTNETSSNSHLTWMVERKECDELDNGCVCENKSRNRNGTTIRCRCDNESQIAHIKSPGRGQDVKHASLFVQKEHWTWKFEHCSKIVLHTELLGTVDGSHFQVEFYNISSFNIHDSAFATKGTYSSHGSQSEVSINFDMCEIESIPTNTFPSFMNQIKFTRCKIKSLARRFIHALSTGEVTIESSKINNIDTEAFYSQTFIETLAITNSTILSVSQNGVASAINKMIWTNSEIQVLQHDALSASVANFWIENSNFHRVESNGFAIKTWSNVIFLNNTFSYVARKGVDLSRYDGEPHVEINGTTWKKVELDFISTGGMESSSISVRDNTFVQECDCDNTFATYLTKNGSSLWVHEEIFNNSKCPVNEKAFGCLIQSGYVNSTESNLLPYESLPLLCDTQVFMCIQGLSEVDTATEDTTTGRPQLPNRLRVLAYFIAAMGIFIICSLIITMCVFLCRKKIPTKKSPSENGPLQNMENAQGKKTGMAKSLSGGEYADIVFKHQNNTSSSSRPRSMLLEDVEMEDKGVQTMPTELSSEVLEGLREKLSRPDSFWDAKETIDHLYDLIQVKELSSGVSSPPDVTMCNGQSTTASTARLLPSTSSSPVAHTTTTTSAGVSVSIGCSSDPQILDSISSPPSNKSSPVSDTPPPLPATSPPSGVPLIQRYAQIRNKAKTAPLCEYADPSDSSMHIYSELTPQLLENERKQKGGEKSSPLHEKLNSPTHHSTPKKSIFTSPSRRPLPNGPILCEYTEPKDVQTHVYAELSNNSAQQKGSGSTPVSPSKTNNLSKHSSPISHSHSNTITIAVPPPPISIPHSNSFHSPRLLGKIKEQSEISSSNPTLATPTSPVKIIHANNLDTSGRSHVKLLSDKLKRSVSSADASRSTVVSPFLKEATKNGGSGSDTQKRPLPSIPFWAAKNEGKSQL